MNNVITLNACMVLVAFIWGFGFVPQRLGLEYLDPAAFNAARFLLGGLTVLPFLLWKKVSLWQSSTVGLGLLLGALLFFGALLQQLSIQYTSLANVAFITGLYVILVPVIGLFIGDRYKLIVWMGGLLAMAGLYLVTGQSSGMSLRGDSLALLGAVFWAFHLMAIARWGGQHSQLLLAFYQFIFCALASAVYTLLFEERSLPTEARAMLWPAVNGIIVVGLAYTLQIVLLQYAQAFLAAIIFSLEAVFGAWAGYLFFDERLGLAALCGAAMMLLGCWLAQLPGSQREP